MKYSRLSRAEALRKAHQAAACHEWLTAEIQASIDDPRPNSLHDEVMDGMDADIAKLETENTKPSRRSNA